ncbi:MAG: hypothetical protein Q9217_004185 [Psora testacea]
MLSILLLTLFSSISLAKPISPQAANAGREQARPAAAVGKPLSEGVTTFDGVALAEIPERPSAEAVAAAAIDRAGWTCTVDSAQAENPCTNVLDGDPATIWHTQFNPTVDPLPHEITIDMQASYLVGSVAYQPRQDSGNGNIGQHVVSLRLSTDGTNFVDVAYGTYIDDNTLKTTTFTPTNGRYMRLRALTEAGGRGTWTTAAEINVFTAGQAAPPSPAGNGAWVLTIDFPLVPVSLANEWASGNILAWSSYDPKTFGGSAGTQTITATYAPGSNTVTSALVTNIQHDMFCEGLSLDFSGRAISTGGNTASATSIFDPASNGWSPAPAMNIARGYQAQTTLSTGNTFTIGASWSGGQGGKNAEIYDPTTNSWSLLSGAPVAPMLTADAQGVYRADNHGWLFGWRGGSVFQAGPSRAMNWYGTTGDGSQTPAGDRAGDPDSMCGNAAMYDAVNGKILTAGGSPNYQDSEGTSNAHIITIGDPDTAAEVQAIGNMAYARAFANSVILPDGTVFITGGQVYAQPFSDDTAQLTPELFNPATNTFTQLAPMAIPRTYHSTALLLPDATVINAGGGLCGDCATNHFDGQIFRPPYLYTGSGEEAPRPEISAVSVGSINVGGTFTATTTGAVDNGFSLVRMGSTTHTVNTDQRRIPLTPSGAAGTTYTLTIPDDAGVALPGYWMLFAIDGAGVPSVARTLQVTP